MGSRTPRPQMAGVSRHSQIPKAAFIETDYLYGIKRDGGISGRKNNEGGRKGCPFVHRELRSICPKTGTLKFRCESVSTERRIPCPHRDRGAFRGRQSASVEHCL